MASSNHQEHLVSKREESWEQKEQKKNPGKIKHGEHWYDPDDIMVAPVDRFAEEFNKAVEEGRWITDQADWYWTHDVIDYWEIISFMIGGFYDDGMSYDKALVLMKRDGWTQYISYTTQQFLVQQRSTCVVRKDTSNCWGNFWDWFSKRVGYFWANLQPYAWTRFSIEWILVGVFEGPWGTGLSLMSPSIFGWFMTLHTYILLSTKLVFNMWLNKWWAGGNLLLMTDEVFSWVAWLFMIMDVFNIETYQYTLRPVRYYSYYVSFVYVIGYSIISVSAFEEFYVRDEMAETDAQSFPEFFKGIALLYLAANFYATYVVNLVIVLKELTMDQMAWTKTEDFSPNEVEGLGLNIDLLYWFGIDEDYDSYLATFKTEFASKYL